MHFIIVKAYISLLLYLWNLTTEGSDDAGEGIAGVSIIEWEGSVLFMKGNDDKRYYTSCTIMLLCLTAVNQPTVQRGRKHTRIGGAPILLVMHAQSVRF